MIVDILSNKKLQKIATKLFIRGRKRAIYFVFITKSYFVVPKNMKIPNKWELQQIEFIHSSDTARL